MKLARMKAVFKSIGLVWGLGAFVGTMHGPWFQLNFNVGDFPERKEDMKCARLCMLQAVASKAFILTTQDTLLL